MSTSQTTAERPSAKTIGHAQASFRQACAYDTMADAIEALDCHTDGSRGLNCYDVEIARLRREADEMRDDVIHLLGENFDEYL